MPLATILQVWIWLMGVHLSRSTSQRATGLGDPVLACVDMRACGHSGFVFFFACLMGISEFWSLVVFVSIWRL